MPLQSVLEDRFFIYDNVKLTNLHYITQHITFYNGHPWEIRCCIFAERIIITGRIHDAVVSVSPGLKST